eukprot:16452222-Heterocapsa_arctica.AAC.1
MGLTSASECPIFQELLPYMVADSNEEHLLLDDEVVQRYWQELPEAWARKNDKIGMSRWFGFVKAMRSLLPIWHKRLVVVYIMCLNEGLLLDGLPSTLDARISSGAPGSSADEPKARTTHQPEELQALRRATKNTLELQALVMGDPQTHRAVKTILVALGPMNENHSKQNKQCRSEAETAQWLASESAGGAFQVLAQLAGTLCSAGALAEVGLCLDGGLKGVAAGIVLDQDHPALVEENTHAETLGKLVLNMIAREFRSAMWHLHAFPGRFFALLGSPEQQHEVLEEMKAYKSLWDEKTSK